MILSWLATALALLAGDRLFNGVFVEGVLPALVAAAVLGLVNATIKPVLFILTLPITFLTLGLFAFVLNAMMLGLVAWVVPGFAIESFWSGVGLAVVVAAIHALVVGAFGKRRRQLRERWD